MTGLAVRWPSGEAEEFTGVELLKQVAQETSLPAFAIGGVSLENLSEVIATDFSRVAVGNAVTAAEDVQAVAEEFIKRLV